MCHEPWFVPCPGEQRPGHGSQAVLRVNTQRCCTDLMIKVWGIGWVGGGGGGGEAPGGVPACGDQQSSRGHASNADIKVTTQKHRKRS